MKPVLQCLAKLSEQQHIAKVRLLAIWFGANDSAVLPSAQHVSLPQFTNNLEQIIRLITASTSRYYSSHTRIVVITPPPVNTYQRRAELAKLDRDFDTTQRYAMAAKQVGIAEGVGVADIWTRLWEAVGMQEQALERYLEDGLHLNADGYKVSTSHRGCHRLLTCFQDCV